MTRTRWAGTCLVVLLLTFFSALLLAYIRLSSALSPPKGSITSMSTKLIVTDTSSSRANTSSSSSATIQPVQPPVPSIIYIKDIYEAGFQTPHPEICPSLGAHQRVLILITSTPSHNGARNAIRLTWGHFSGRTDLAFAFFLGSPPDVLKESLIEEDGLYGDLIIGNSVDSYSNLTLKTLSMLEWTSKYCPRVPYVLKTDDDVFINIPQLLNFLQKPYVAIAKKVIWGRKMTGSVWPNRDQTHRYYVPFAEYPAEQFPDFVSGPAYLMTGDCILPLLEAAADERFVRLEDVFVTGLLARICGIRRNHNSRFHSRLDFRACFIRFTISIHRISYREQFSIWRKLNDNNFICRTSPRRPVAIPPPAC